MVIHADNGDILLWLHFVVQICDGARDAIRISHHDTDDRGRICHYRLDWDIVLGRIDYNVHNRILNQFVLLFMGNEL